MKYIFEHIKKTSRGAGNRLLPGQISVTTSGISMSKDVFLAIGSPKYVDLLVDRTNSIIGFKKSVNPDDGYKIETNSNGASQCGLKIISDLVSTGRYNVRVEDGIALFQVDAIR